MRLRDVPATIGWDGLALFVRHLPHDSALAREIEPSCLWTPEMYALATISDQISNLMWSLGGGAGARPQPARRPGATERYEGAEVVNINDRIAGLEWEDVDHGG